MGAIDDGTLTYATPTPQPKTLKDYLKSNGYTMSAFAKKAGVEYYILVGANKRKPITKSTFLKMAAALDITEDAAMTVLTPFVELLKEDDDFKSYIRNRYGYTLKDLVAITGLSHCSISRMSAGQKVSKETFNRIKKGLGIKTNKETAVLKRYVKVAK